MNADDRSNILVPNYNSVKSILYRAKSVPSKPDPIIYTDSAVVANHINGKWKCKNKTLIPLLMTIEEIRSEFKFRVVQVPRNIVWEPDYLCKQFLDQLEKRKEKDEKK